MSEGHHPGRQTNANAVGNFVHRFVPGKDSPTLLLLHGTGGNEDDLLPLGREISPGSALLSPRGKVLEGGAMPRFFRRLAEGVFDLEDLKFRTEELSDFVGWASKEYGFDSDTVVAVGYSNGANIAASMLLLRPRVLSGAILFRAMVPLVPDKLPNLSGKQIFLSEGMFDPIVEKSQATGLEGLLRRCGANVKMNWEEAEHSLLREEISKAKRFLEENIP